MKNRAIHKEKIFNTINRFHFKWKTGLNKSIKINPGTKELPRISLIRLAKSFYFETLF
jgi:hypothetical protein